MNSFPYWGSAVTAFLCLFFTTPLLANLDDCAVCDVNRDRAALVALYNATNGANWTNNTNWNTANSIDTWHGITTNNDGCVRHIQLSDNNLSGSLPSSLGNLTELDLLDLANNQLIGSIPSTIGNLTLLRLLSLHGNQLVGTLPTTLGNLSNLLNLYLQNNKLSGAIPSQIDGMVSLVNLNLRNNDLTGNIPATIGDLTQLVTLNLSQNDLTGSIPIDIGELTNLKLLYLEQNNLSGSIPMEMGQLTELVQLWLNNNQLSDNIPANLGNLSKVQLFRLGHNNLMGSIPPELGNLASVQQFWLHDNQLTGSIPPELGNLPTMTYLKLDVNQLTGSIPASLANNQALQFMHLRNNDLSGTLPPEIARLTNLQQLYFGSNPNLVGCIPAEYTVFCDLGTQVAINATGLNHTNFANFCSNGLGACVTNDNCGVAVALPMNKDICGSNSIKLLLNGITDSGIEPVGCGVAERDIWLKAVVPPTQNFKVQFTSQTTINPFIAAYRSCAASNFIKCNVADEEPNAIYFDDTEVVAGETIYLQIWDRDNTVLNTNDLHYLELSAHELPVDKTQWQDCENRLDDTNPNGGGKYNATEFIIQFDPGTTADEIAALRTSNFPQVTLNKICPCQPRLQVWGESDPVMMEACRKGSRTAGKVDTTVYNYVFEPIEVEPVIDEIGDDLLPTSTYLDVAVAPNGDFTVGYKFSDLQRFIAYDKFGQPKTVQNDLLDGYLSFDVVVPSLSMNINEELAIISTHENGACQEVVLHKYNDTGNNIFTKELFCVSCSDSDCNVEIEYLSNGDIVVVWETEEASVNKLLLQIFHPNGVAKTEIVEVATSIKSTSLPRIASSVAGTFIVGYQIDINNPPLSTNPYYLKRFSEQGLLLNNYIISSNEFSSSLPFELAMNDRGEGIMAWQEFSSNDFKARKITETGSLEPTITLKEGTIPDKQQNVRAVLLNDGSFVVSWVDESPVDENINLVFAQRFHADSAPLAEPYLVSNEIIVHPTSLNMKLGHDNSLIFAWISDGNEKVYVLVDRAGEKVSSPNQPRNTAFNYNPIDNAPKVLVAVADSGIKSDHPYFQNALWQTDDGNICLSDQTGHDLTQYDLQNQLYNDPFPNDTDKHGTGVNGVIIESFPNDIKLDLMNIKFYEAGKSTLFDGVCGIYYAIEAGADIINLSWGFEAAEPPAVLRDALLKAQSAGILVVTSAGNTAKNNDNIKKYPANYSTDLDNIITVTAFDHALGNANDIKLADYASFGQTKVDIAAKGFVETAALDYPTNPTPEQLRQTLVGTSLAAPAVTKIAAIITGKYPQLTYREVKNCILDNAAPVPALQTQVATGGILDSLAALTCAANKAAMIDAACAETNLSLTATVTAESCARKDGAIDLVVSGTNTDLTYEWSNGAMTEDVNELIADAYFVTVTNAEGCVKTLQTEVNQACALPLELLDFTATPQSSAIQVTWTVLNNDIVKHFNLLRSTDGTNFTKISTLASATTRAAQYQFTDKNVVMGQRYYYQLETVEQTGEMVTSPIRFAQLATANEYRFYPNPTRGIVHFELPENKEEVTLELYNHLGQLVRIFKNKIDDNILDMNDLAVGIYNVKVKIGERVLGVEKLILQ